MPGVINPRIDVAAVRRALDVDGVAVVEDFCAPALAERILTALEDETAWDLAYSGDGQGRLLRAAELERMEPHEVRAAVGAALEYAPSSFQFAYNTFTVTDAIQSGAVQTSAQMEHFLFSLAAAWHTPEHIAFVRELTGREGIERVSMMAARYLPGHFLTLHDDAHEGERREVAYVLNLTKDWPVEWGGLLHIVEPDRRTVRTAIRPAFNRLVLMRPPMWHFVSQVASYAQAPRYTLTGGMLAS